MTSDPDSLGDLELRLVRYFVAIARCGNLSRAARAVRVGQPALSRQITRLETHLGVRLLDRTAQGSSLTEAGRVFLPVADALLSTARDGAAAMRAIAAPPGLTVGYTGSLVVTPAVRAVREAHPPASVTTLHLAWHDVEAALTQRRVDVAVARAPVGTGHVDVAVLYEVPRAVLVPRTHDLAARATVRFDDIAEEPLVRYDFDPDGSWNAFWRVEPRADGSPAPGGPLVSSLEDKHEQVAGGQALAVTVVAGPHDMPRPDLVAVPIVDIEPSSVVLATRHGDGDPLVEAFRRRALALLRSPVTDR